MAGVERSAEGWMSLSTVLPGTARARSRHGTRPGQETTGELGLASLTVGLTLARKVHSETSKFRHLPSLRARRTRFPLDPHLSAAEQCAHFATRWSSCLSHYGQAGSRDTLYRSLMQHELFGPTVSPVSRSRDRPPLGLANRASNATSVTHSPIFSFKVGPRPRNTSKENLPVLPSPSFLSPTARSALKDNVARRLRARPTHSFRVLDAPDMVYPLRSVLTWSSKNSLAVALQRTAIYLLPDAEVSVTPSQPAVHLTSKLSVGEVSSLSWDSAVRNLCGSPVRAPC